MRLSHDAICRGDDAIGAFVMSTTPRRSRGGAAARHRRRRQGHHRHRRHADRDGLADLCRLAAEGRRADGRGAAPSAPARRSIGKTATTPFAHLDPTPTRNPRNPGHTPGGSSSGSAAAVAAGHGAARVRHPDRRLDHPPGLVLRRRRDQALLPAPADRRHQGFSWSLDTLGLFAATRGGRRLRACRPDRAATRSASTGAPPQRRASAS